MPSGLIGLEYWFYYPFNYYPLVVNSDLMNGAPIAGDELNVDLHQGDWEHVDVLLNPKTFQTKPGRITSDLERRSMSSAITRHGTCPTEFRGSGSGRRMATGAATQRVREPAFGGFEHRCSKASPGRTTAGS